MSGRREEIWRAIVENCIYAEEPFFVLVGYLRSQDELALLVELLVEAVNKGWLKCWRGTEQKTTATTLTVHELHQYIRQRLDAGECLTDATDAGFHYEFRTTEKGKQEFLARGYEL